MPTATAPAVEPFQALAESPHVARIISSDSVPAGGFTPGMILADRYRIIGLLGRGGMGEVYRADDLKLGQPVALKFLPPEFAEDSVRRERFFAEVRITRQLSHPNICRVYDIGEIDGRHFLSMEYIDGEDLASLLKRIGHLTNEKALDIARQLAAGLSAAHERGVLHRDLKPANIMLDGHGRVRITDFGLAIAVEDAANAAEIAGTPAYMAPEQLSGKGATVRSDMYSLGLVLYEIYTGKKVFTAMTLAELRQQKETHTPRAISELREGMDPIVERLIRRCMERDPSARPASVSQLALALPGGDPLAAALAAGETPSPEMVAASGSKEGLRPAIAWGLLALIILGTLAIIMIRGRASSFSNLAYEKSPEVLVERAREFLKKSGYPGKPVDSAFGFVENTDYLRYMANSDRTAKWWETLDAKALLFWYRQSPRPLQANVKSDSGLVISRIAPDNPTLQFSGEVLVTLDVEGRLVSFQAVPPQPDSSVDAVPTPDWTIFFAEASLDPSQWTPSDARRSPFTYADIRTAWQKPPSNKPGAPVRIEAAAFQGKPVSFEIIGPWTRDAGMDSHPPLLGERIQLVGWTVLLLLIIVVGLFFALRNLRLGRGDRRSAIRMAIIIAGLSMFAWILDAHHIPTVWEIDNLRLALAVALLNGGLFWIIYVALEPFVRRRWPQVLISWTRFLAGDWKDPLIGRDALVGCAFGVACICTLLVGNFYIPYWFGYADITSLTGFSFSIEEMAGIGFFLSSVLRSIITSFWYNLGAIFFVFLLRILLKNQKAAVCVSVLILPLLTGPDNPWSFFIMMLMFAMWLFMTMRFGMVAGVISIYSAVLFVLSPIGAHASSAWLSVYDYVALAIFAALVLYAFRTSLGGRPLLVPSSLDD
jgi:hypothetical protein